MPFGLVQPRDVCGTKMDRANLVISGFTNVWLLRKDDQGPLCRHHVPSGRLSDGHVHGEVWRDAVVLHLRAEAPHLACRWAARRIPKDQRRPKKDDMATKEQHQACEFKAEVEMMTPS